MIHYLGEFIGTRCIYILETIYGDGFITQLSDILSGYQTLTVQFQDIAPYIILKFFVEMIFYALCSACYLTMDGICHPIEMVVFV